MLDGINTALDSGKDPGEILNTGMITAMGEVGWLFEEGEYFVPEMLISARELNWHGKGSSKTLDYEDHILPATGCIQRWRT